MIKEIAESDATNSRFSKPFDSILTYYLLSLVLSLTIIVCLVVLEWCFGKFDMMTLAFSTMLKVSRRRLRCFNVDITSTPEYKSIKEACVWLLRIIVVAILCYLWQTCFMYQTTTKIHGTPVPERIKLLCDSGLLCVYYENQYMIFILWAKYNAVIEVCPLANNSDELTKAIGSGPGFLTCLGLPTIDSLGLITRLTIAFALSQLILGLYQLLAWIIFRSKYTIFQLIYVVLSITIIILYFAAFAIPQFFLIDTWFTSIVYFGFPVILLCARATGLATKKILRQQLALRVTIPLDASDVPQIQTSEEGSRLAPANAFSEMPKTLMRAKTRNVHYLDVRSQEFTSSETNPLSSVTDGA